MRQEVTIFKNMQLKIYSTIVSDKEMEIIQYWGGDGVSFSGVDDFIANIPEDDDTIDLRINCNGGDVDTGWAIVDKLRATGKKITATIEGKAASMAVTVLLAASERKAYKHAELLIHKPYYPEYTLSSAYNEDDLEKLKNQLHESTEKILDFMVERTGSDRAKLEKLMEEEKFIDMEEAKEYGFIHEILEPISAKSTWPDLKNSKTRHMANETTEMSFARKAVSALASVFGLSIQIVDEDIVDKKKDKDPEPKNYNLTTEAGGEITIEKPEGEDPAVGDSASPDGSHKMPDGTTIVIEGGKITDILPAEEDKGGKKKKDEGTDPDPKDEMINQLKAEIDQLKAQNQELSTVKDELTAAQAEAKNEDEKAILDIVEKAGGKAWLEGAAKSTYVVAQRKQKINAQTEPTSMESELKALREKIASQKSK